MKGASVLGSFPCLQCPSSLQPSGSTLCPFQLLPVRAGLAPAARHCPLLIAESQISTTLRGQDWPGHGYQRVPELPDKLRSGQGQQPPDRASSTSLQLVPVCCARTLTRGLASFESCLI